MLGEAFSMNSLGVPFGLGHVHECKIRIYFEDTDVAGIVYHANYLKFMERGRTEWLRELGFDQSTIAKIYNMVFVVAALNVNFKKPAKIDEILVVKTSIHKIGSASVELKQALENERSELNCHGLVRLGCVDRTSLRLMRIPEELKGKINYVD